MYRGLGDTKCFRFISMRNQRLLRGRSLGEIIQDEVGNVLRAAAAVTEPSVVGMIAEHSSSSFLPTKAPPPTAHLRHVAEPKSASSLIPTRSSLALSKLEKRGVSTNGILEHGRKHQFQIFSAALIANRHVISQPQTRRGTATPADIVQSVIDAHGYLLAVCHSHRCFVRL